MPKFERDKSHNDIRIGLCLIRGPAPPLYIFQILLFPVHYLVDSHYCTYFQNQSLQYFVHAIKQQNQQECPA